MAAGLRHNLDTLLDKVSKGDFDQFVQRRKPIDVVGFVAWSVGLPTNSTPHRIAIIVVLSMLFLVVCVIPVGLYIFVNYVAMDDELFDLSDRWWYEVYVECGYRLRRLFRKVFVRAPSRSAADAARRAEERAPLQQTEMADCRQRRPSARSRSS